MKNSHSANSQGPLDPAIEASADTNNQFGSIEWLLALGMAITWGSSFLLIDIIIRDAPAAFVPFGRSFFGMVALFFVPQSREKIAREHRLRLLILGFIWMAMPFYSIVNQLFTE